MRRGCFLAQSRYSSCFLTQPSGHFCFPLPATFLAFLLANLSQPYWTKHSPHTAPAQPHGSVSSPGTSMLQRMHRGLSSSSSSAMQMPSGTRRTVTFVLPSDFS